MTVYSALTRLNWISSSVWQCGSHTAAAHLQRLRQPGWQISQEHGAALGRAGRQHHCHQPASGCQRQRRRTEHQGNPGLLVGMAPASGSASGARTAKTFLSLSLCRCFSSCYLSGRNTTGSRQAKEERLDDQSLTGSAAGQRLRQPVLPEEAEDGQGTNADAVPLVHTQAERPCEWVKSAAAIPHSQIGRIKSCPAV